MSGNRVTEKYETNRDKVYMSVSGEMETIKELRDFVASKEDLTATVVADPMMFVIEELIADYQYNFMTKRDSDNLDVEGLVETLYKNNDFLNYDLFHECMEEYVDVDIRDIE